MKFQIYTDDGRWVSQYEVDSKEFEKEFNDSWTWIDFFDHMKYIKDRLHQKNHKEEN